MFIYITCTWLKHYYTILNQCSISIHQQFLRTEICDFIVKTFDQHSSIKSHINQFYRDMFSFIVTKLLMLKFFVSSWKGSIAENNIFPLAFAHGKINQRMVKIHRS